MNKTIKEFCKTTAIDISERKLMNIDEVATMLEVRILASLLDFISEYSSIEEKKYLDLLNIQKQNKVGSQKYNEIAYKLTAVKAKKAAANRAINNIKRDDKYEMLKQWIIDKYGESEFKMFTKEKYPVSPIYSTTTKNN